MFNDTEEAVYSQLQKDVLAAKEEGSYALLTQRFGFTSNHHIRVRILDALRIPRCHLWQDTESSQATA